MIEYATRKDLLSIGSKISINEQASLRKRAEDRSPNGATFLSHSSEDKELVIGAVRLLENHDAHVYIDKKDPALLDRLTHHCHILETGNDSWRFKNRE